MLWSDVKRHRKDYELLFAYMEWEYQEREKAFEAAKDKAKKRR